MLAHRIGVQGRVK